MTKSIAWHEQCLVNWKRTMKEREAELLRLNTMIEHQRVNLNFYVEQIETAKKEGKEGFDSGRYLVKRVINPIDNQS